MRLYVPSASRRLGIWLLLAHIAGWRKKEDVCGWMQRLQPSLRYGERRKYSGSSTEPLEISRCMKKIAARLSSLEDCSDRTAVQCREKVKKLKCEYRKAKNNNNRLGRGRTICAFFKQLDAILACTPTSAPDTVVGSIHSVGDQ